jgi:DNA-binding transcriptional LysR family regulator
MEMLNEMAVFAQVVDSAGFSAAARQLRLTTSAVSRHVTRLEAHLGGRLLVRTTRSLKCTELGEQVYAACTRMLSTAREVHTLAGSYSARPNGLVRLTAPVVFGQVWLAPRLPGFLARYPDVSVNLSLVDRTVDLVDEGVDLAIRIARELNPGIAARTLCPMRYLLVASPAYLAQRGTPAHPKDLPGHACVYLGYGAFGDTWTLRQAADTVQVSVGTRAQVNNSAAIIAMVEADGGIGLVPDFSARAALAAGRVVQVLAQWDFAEPYSGTVHAVYMPGPHLPQKTRALIDYLVETQSLSI